MKTQDKEAVKQENMNVYTTYNALSYVQTIELNEDEATSSNLIEIRCLSISA